MHMLELELLNGTPIFSIQSTDSAFSRVHSAVFDKARGRWLFPAYPPFAQRALDDLKKVAPLLKMSPEAAGQADYLGKVQQLITDRTLPAGFEFVTKPFDHQVEGLVHMLHYPRFGLLWDAGTGKSKVMVDLKRALPRRRWLIVTPKVTVRNWVKEFAIHGGPDIKVAAVVGDAPRKRKIIERYKEYDVLVCSYGTVRTLGLPRLHKNCLKLIKEARAAGRKISDSGVVDLVKAVRVVSDPDRQAAFILGWALGTPVAQVARYAAEEAKQKAQWLEDIEYETMVLDESHNVKEPGTQQTKTVHALGRKAARRYIMSGTSTLGDPRHLRPQMKFLSPAIFPEDDRRFDDLFLIRSEWNKRVVTGFKNMNIVNARVQRVATRKKKEECLDLPPRKIIDIPVEMSHEQISLYNMLASSMAADLNNFFDDPSSARIEVQNAATLLNKLAQVTSGFIIDSQRKADICNECPYLARCVDEGIQPYTTRCRIEQQAPESKLKYLKSNPKLEALDGILDTIFQDPSNKVIIWGVYKAELTLICDMLEKKGIGHVRVDGSTGNAQLRVDKFNEDPKCRAYVGQVATGIGITLNAATYMIYYTLDWSLGTYLQSIDRNYRAGQSKKVTVYRLLGEKTVDEYKAIALDEKKDISAVLTNKLSCVACEKRVECLKNGTELFDPGCVYKRSVKRTIAKAEVIA